ncbi:MAG: protease inhibitor I42 family protein [Methanosarcinaceae archaeon]|nr:protease inhibitor I42 family protein [Methanosarcinaceae archaeon]
MIRTIAIISMLLIVITGLGCLTEENIGDQEEIPTEYTETTSIQSVTNTYGEDNDQDTVYGIKGDIIIVELEENPTTGYSWNLTYSEGLELSEDNYTQENNTEEMVGAGGFHQWTFKLTDTGEQKISAVYMKPWEERTGDENTFDLTIISLAEDELINS